METSCYCTSLRVAARRLTAAYDRALAPAGVTTTQYALLSRVQAGPLSVGQLAERLELERSTATRNVQVLARQGLVALQAAARDRRVTEVVLSEQGAQVLALAGPLWRAAQQEFEERVGGEHAAGLRASVLAL